MEDMLPEQLNKTVHVAYHFVWSEIMNLEYPPRNQQLNKLYYMYCSMSMQGLHGMATDEEFEDFLWRKKNELETPSIPFNWAQN